MTAWSDLPNAAHIDAILADVGARPGVWENAWDEGWRDEWADALDAALETVKNVDWDAVWAAAGATIRSVVWDEIWGAVCALVSWPESAALLDLTPDALRTIISTHDGDVKHHAVLLLPAVIAHQSSTV